MIAEAIRFAEFRENRARNWGKPSIAQHFQFNRRDRGGTQRKKKRDEMAVVAIVSQAAGIWIGSETARTPLHSISLRPQATNFHREVAKSAKNILLAFFAIFATLR